MLLLRMYADPPGIPVYMLIQLGTAFAAAVVCDAKPFRDTAPFEKPHGFAAGFSYVLVNGVAVMKSGEHTGARPRVVPRSEGSIEGALFIGQREGTSNIFARSAGGSSGRGNVDPWRCCFCCRSRGEWGGPASAARCCTAPRSATAWPACVRKSTSESPRITRASGARFVTDPVVKVKIEGAGMVGQRRLAIVGIRDPYTIGLIDKAIAWGRGKLEERFGPAGESYQCFFHVYGRDAVMGALEPSPPRQPHELCIVVEALHRDAKRAEEICALGARNLFYARLPEVKGTAGAGGRMADERRLGEARPHPLRARTARRALCRSHP